jgi:Fic family protein
MQKNKLGMTETYNRLHNPDDADPAVVELRSRREELTNYVAGCYGFDDLDLDFGFHEVAYLPENDCMRYTISDESRLEVLRRLADFNRERYLQQEGEINIGPQKPISTAGQKRKQEIDTSDQSEFVLSARMGPQPSGSEDASGAAEMIVSHLKVRRTWLSKADILAYVDIPANQWTAAINDLLASGILERHGERRSARYRISESD